MTVQESEARLPGWTLLRTIEGGKVKSNRYRAPSGDEVGQWAYASALKHYQKTGVIPQSPLGNNWKKYARTSSSKSPVNNAQYEDLTIEIPIDDNESIVVDLPESKPTPAKNTKSGLFNAKQLSEGLATILVIATAILAVITKLPEAQMTESEVRGLSIPLANIIERSRYNKIIGAAIVDKSDYMTLGYVLYTYIDRVGSAARMRKSHGEPTGYPGPTQVPAGGGIGTNGSTEGLSYKTAPSGLRNITGGL